MEKIKSITEAFSMQPNTFETKNQIQHENTIKYSNSIANRDCKEIIFEKHVIGHKCGDPLEELYYVGYNFEGQKIFQYIANTVNVHFETV